MKQVLIVGGGVAGLRVAIALSAQVSKHKIILVDQREYHEPPYRPLENVRFTEPEAYTFRNIAKRHGFTYVRGVIQDVHVREQVVTLKDRQVPYEYLVCALGSSASLPSEFAYPVISSLDRERVAHALKFAAHRCRQSSAQRYITVALIGGGITGVVTTAQLGALTHRIAQEVHIPVERFKLVCYERNARLLPNYAHSASREIEGYLKKLGVSVQCHMNAEYVTSSCVGFEGGEERAADVVVWAGGWRANTVVVRGGIWPLGARDQVLVNNKFQVHSWPNIFVVGDQASPPFPHRHGAVRETLAEAEYVASILPRVMQNMRVNNYVPRNHAEYVPLGSGKALRILRNLAQTGLLARMGLRRIERKYRSVLGM